MLVREDDGCLNVVARIQAHPSRSHLHRPLVDGLAPLPTEVSLHASEPPNPWHGYKQALTDIPECSHLLVIQDDVTLCRNFPLAIRKIAEAQPDTPVILFLGGLPKVTATKALQAAKRGAHYVPLQMREFCPCVAILWPRHKALEFMDWVARTPKIPGYPKPASDDAVLGRWTITTRQHILCTIPSLVEHEDLVDSVIGRRNTHGEDKTRRALLWWPDQDPLDIDWS